MKVRYNEARYGRSNGYPCGDNVCNNSYDLVRPAGRQAVRPRLRRRARHQRHLR
ncbi:hypothetical protein ACQPW3_14415 [Actinosynnema sp. CA-248983]